MRRSVTLLYCLVAVLMALFVTQIVADEDDPSCKNSPSMSDAKQVRNYVNNCLKARDRIRFRKRFMPTLTHDNISEYDAVKQNILQQLFRQHLFERPTPLLDPFLVQQIIDNQRNNRKHDYVPTR